jgi:hypothetical protein
MPHIHWTYIFQWHVSYESITLKGVYSFRSGPETIESVELAVKRQVEEARSSFLNEVYSRMANVVIGMMEDGWGTGYYNKP